MSRQFLRCLEMEEVETVKASKESTCSSHEPRANGDRRETSRLVIEGRGRSKGEVLGLRRPQHWT